MSQRLTRGTALMLTVPPLMWAGNTVVGRLVRDDIPPFTLNFLRWVIAFAILLPLAAWVLRRSGGMWEHWRRFAVLGLFGVGLYNNLQGNKVFQTACFWRHRDGLARSGVLRGEHWPGRAHAGQPQPHRLTAEPAGHRVNLRDRRALAGLCPRQAHPLPAARGGGPPSSGYLLKTSLRRRPGRRPRLQSRLREDPLH